MGGWPPVLGTRDSRDKKRDDKTAGMVLESSERGTFQRTNHRHNCTTAGRRASWAAGLAGSAASVQGQAASLSAKSRHARVPSGTLGRLGRLGAAHARWLAGWGVREGEGGVGTSAFMKIQGPGRSKEPFSAAASFLCGRVYGFFF